MKRLHIFIVLVVGNLGFAAVEPAGLSIEEQLNSLNVPANQAPAGIADERMYAVQTRYNPLQYRPEFTLGGANNFSSNSFLSSNQLQGALKFYLTDRWYLETGGSIVFNELTDAAVQYQQQNGRVPDVPYVKHRLDFLVGFHTFYGKFRVSMDQVFYFDHYVAIGPGMIGEEHFVETSPGIIGKLAGTQYAAVADTGFVFWFGKQFSARLGLKDYFFNEKRLSSQGNTHHFLGHVDVGFIFGS